MVWENLNIPGLTNSDKKELYEKYRKNLIKDIHRLQMLPKDEERIANLRSICLYLVEKTANQDESIKINYQKNQKWTSLFFAVETDDKEICRALLKNGANPNLHLGTTPEWGYITFLKRCISFEAWDVLEMFLSEFSEMARVTINESDNMYGLSSLTAFLQKMIEIRKYTPDKYKGREFVLNMVNLFGQCGASYNQPSMFGSANDMLKFI